MKITISFLILLMFPMLLIAQNIITDEDLNSITGTWTGTLTYIDYSSGNPFTMPANVTITKGKNSLKLANEYPNEPKANGTDTIKISKDRSQINKNPIVSRQVMMDGRVELITENQGKDNNKKALIRNIFLFGEKNLLFRKEVKFEGETDWLKRSEFKYRRKD